MRNSHSDIGLKLENKRASPPLMASQDFGDLVGDEPHPVDHRLHLHVYQVIGWKQFKDLVQGGRPEPAKFRGEPPSHVERVHLLQGCVGHEATHSPDAFQTAVVKYHQLVVSCETNVQLYAVGALLAGQLECGRVFSGAFDRSPRWAMISGVVREPGGKSQVVERGVGIDGVVDI